MTSEYIADVLNKLRQVWVGTDNATEILVDVCATFADHLDLKDDKRDEFMTDCGWQKIWR